MSDIGLKGKLYLCATPIGNLEDITLRVLRILKEVDLIAAEDTRHTQKLLNHFAISTPITSYFEHNKREKGMYLIEQLKAGKHIALVSDAGMPGVSDPGADLVKLCVDTGVELVALPGPTALITALVISGLSADRFAFYGFLPKGNRARERLLPEIQRHTATLLFYEAPHRLRKTLYYLRDKLGDRKAAAARELTKRFEEVIRCTLSELIDYFSINVPRGEFTLVVDGISAEELRSEQQALLSDPLDHVYMLMARGEDKKQAIKQAALLHGLSKRDIYQMLLRENFEK